MSPVAQPRERLPGYISGMKGIDHGASTKAQDEFVANITHDLKSPLSSIYSAMEMVIELADDRLTPTEKKLLDISRRNSLRLMELIDELLDYSKLESGSMKVKSAPTPLGGVVREAVDGLRPTAEAAGQTLELGPGVDEFRGSEIQADPRRVIQIITNLLSNAVKATPEGGRIAVDVAPRRTPVGGWEYVFSVTDTGCGIAPENHEKVFQRFTQVGGYQKGAGLGLTICQSLVELHGGAVWLDSALGRGTTFFFSLPAVTEPAGHTEAPRAVERCQGRGAKGRLHKRPDSDFVVEPGGLGRWRPEPMPQAVFFMGGSAAHGDDCDGLSRLVDFVEECPAMDMQDAASHVIHALAARGKGGGHRSEQTLIDLAAYREWDVEEFSFRGLR